MEFTEEQWAGLARSRRRARAALPQLAVLGARRSSCSSVSASRPGRSPRARSRTSRCSTGWRDEAAGAPLERDERAGGARRGGRTSPRARAPLAVLQCTSAYPCPPGADRAQPARRAAASATAARSGSRTTPARSTRSLAAVALGASVIEVHVTLSREMFGPDVPASVTPDELRELVEGVRFIERALANPVDKDAAPRRSGRCAQLFTRASSRAGDLAAGTVLGRAAPRVEEAGQRHPARRACETSSGGASPRRAGRRAVRRSRDARMMTRKVCVVITARPSYAGSRRRCARSRSTPTSSCSWWSPPRPCSTATATASTRSSTTASTSPPRVYMVLEGENLVTSAKTTGLGLVELATVFDNLKPDVVVTRRRPLRDARHRRRRGLHRTSRSRTCRAARSPARSTRRCATRSPSSPDLHLVVDRAGAPSASSAWARTRTSVFVTGCPRSTSRREVAARAGARLRPVRELRRRRRALRPLDDGYLVVMQHPVTTEYDEARAPGRRRRCTRCDELDLPSAVVLAERRRRLGRHVERHPRLPRARAAGQHPLLQEHGARGLPAAAAATSTAIVGNSSVGIRECSFLGVPAVNIGDRQEGRERGRNVIDVDHDRDGRSRRPSRKQVAQRPLRERAHLRRRAARASASPTRSPPCELTIEKRLRY